MTAVPEDYVRTGHRGPQYLNRKWLLRARTFECPGNHYRALNDSPESLAYCRDDQLLFKRDTQASQVTKTHVRSVRRSR